MGSITVDLTERERAIYDQVQTKLEKQDAYLAALTSEERLAWFAAHQYPHPISFERGIGGTIYTVNAHFSERATESIEDKAKRILTENFAH